MVDLTENIDLINVPEISEKRETLTKYTQILQTVFLEISVPYEFSLESQDFFVLMVLYFLVHLLLLVEWKVPLVTVSVR